MTTSSTRHALVTGASSGMGKSFAQALLREGFNVFAAARRLDQMDDLVELGAIAIRMDISREDEVVAAANQVAESTQGRGVDVLVNNAGFGLYGAMEDTSLEDARYQFEVNLFGLARLTQLLLPAMREKQSGKVINISSMGGKMYTPLGSWYHASKHALEGWSDCLRLELAPLGIDVVVIEPGVIKTEFADVLLEPLIQRSGESPYREMASALAKATRESIEKQQGSDPQVITDLVLKAVRAKKPQTRYSAGQYAKPMMFLRKYFGDRAFDGILRASLR